jgi:hypothetical protein
MIIDVTRKLKILTRIADFIKVTRHGLNPRKWMGKEGAVIFGNIPAIKLFVQINCK